MLLCVDLIITLLCVKYNLLQSAPPFPIRRVRSLRGAPIPGGAPSQLLKIKKTCNKTDASSVCLVIHTTRLYVALHKI